MKYVDVTVRISPRGEHGYGVLVESSVGHANSRLDLPFTLSELAGVVYGVSQTLRDITTVAEPVATGPRAREFGEKLFEALFHGDVRSVLDRATAVAQERRETGVRIRLSMDLQGEGMAEVTSLPWELMRPRNQTPLVTSTNTLLVRSPDILAQADPRPFQPPLRILAMVARPRGTAPLNLDEERDRIQKIWRPVVGVTVEFVAPVVTELLRRLREADFHVVHYMGHGDFDAVTGRGVLLLEDKNGEPHLVSGEDLGVYLKDEVHQGLRLVFLNACKTGTTSSRTGFDPFAGIATGLIQAGVPAVVAMQFPISDEAATDFADTFYQSIAGGLPVDAAVAEGRKALWSGEQSEWATPVLFLRSSDGFLFKPIESSTADGGTPLTSSGSSAPAPGLPADEPWGTGSGPKVLLAAPDQDLGSIHRQLASALRKQGVRVVDSVPPPYDAEEHAAKVRGLVRGADLCVHLLGDGPGAAIDEEPSTDTHTLRTYPLEQLRIGLEAARSQLVLIPDQVDIESIEDAEYARRIRELRRMPRDDVRFQLVTTGKQQLTAAVMARLGELEAAARAAQSASAPGNAVRTAFVDLHYDDLQNAAELITYLGQRNIAPILMPSSDTSPAEALSVFESNLAKVPLYVVVFGSVTRDWVTNRLSVAFQSVLRHPGATTRIGVYLAPPVKGADQLRFPPFCDMAANMDGFDATSVDALIARATE